MKQLTEVKHIVIFCPLIVRKKTTYIIQELFTTMPSFPHQMDGLTTAPLFLQLIFS